MDIRRKNQWTAAVLAFAAVPPLLAPEKQQQQEGDFPVGRPQHHGKVTEFNRIVKPSAINLPPGYRVEAVATGLNFPSDVTFGPDGEMYASEAGGHFYGTDPSQAPRRRSCRSCRTGARR